MIEEDVVSNPDGYQLSDLDISAANAAAFSELVGRPGLVIFQGPTGTGKTTVIESLLEAHRSSPAGVEGAPSGATSNRPERVPVSNLGDIRARDVALQAVSASVQTLVLGSLRIGSLGGEGMRLTSR